MTAEDKRIPSFQEAQDAMTPGHRFVRNTFYKNYRGGAERFQGSSTEQERAKEAFRLAVLSNAEVTLHDVVDFLAEHGISWSIDQTYHYKRPKPGF